MGQQVRRFGIGVGVAEPAKGVDETDAIRRHALLRGGTEHQQPHEGQRSALLKMDFKRFADSLIRVPCQIVRSGRRIVYRLLAWTPWLEALWRLSIQMRLPMRC